MKAPPKQAEISSDIELPKSIAHSERIFKEEEGKIIEQDINQEMSEIEEKSLQISKNQFDLKEPSQSK